jgi:flagellin-like hook-associated protein FlgL
MRQTLLCLFILVSSFAQAQQLITGRVLDATTKAPLAFVPFVIEGTHSGTTSDIDGKFSLAVQQLPVTLRASYVGYETAMVIFNDATPQTVQLTASNTELHAVEIAPTENPAHRIIRRVYANRKENDGMRYRSYRYTSYSKTVFDAQKDTTKAVAADSISVAEPDTTAAFATDTLTTDTADQDFMQMLTQQHLFLIESATKKSFIPPAAEKEEVVAMRVSGLKDPSFLALVAQTKTFSIYSPQIDISDKSYLGPIGPGSTAKYYYHLEDTLYQGKDSVFVISYRPRTGTKYDGLKGLLYINTDGYAVQNVTAEPMKKTGVSIRFQQQHERLPTADGGSAWFPVQLNSFIYMNSLRIGGMLVVGEGRTYLKNIEMDVDIARKEVRGPELVMDKLSMRKDDAFWAGLREDSLGSKDLRTYEMLDSLGEKEHFDRKLKFVSALTTGKLPIGPVDLLLARLFNYNDYEGLRLGAGLSTNDRVTKYASLGGYFAYGFKDRNWKYGGDLTIKPLYGRDLQLKLSYENDVSETGGVGFEGASKTFGTDSYRMFFVDRMDRIERYAGQVMLRAGSSLKLWVGTERALRVNDIGYRYVVPVNDAVELQRNDFLTGAVTFDMRWAFHERLARLPDRELSLGTKFPVVYVHAMRAVKGLWEGEWDTWRVDAMVEKTFKIRLLGELSLQLMGGMADAEAPMPFLYNLRGINDPHFPVAGSNVFETMRPNEFLADRYVSFHLKHSFGALLVRTKHFRPRPAIVSSVAFGDLSHPENHQGLDFKPLRDGYFESGLQVDNLLKFGFASFGVGAYYRYGPYALPDPGDNIAVKVTAGYAF